MWPCFLDKFTKGMCCFPPTHAEKGRHEEKHPDKQRVQGDNKEADSRDWLLYNLPRSDGEIIFA